MEDIFESIVHPTPLDPREEIGGRRVPEGYTEIDLGMSNYDQQIDEGFGEALKAGMVFGSHSAWEFNGSVWFEAGLFHEEVWRYRVYQETVSASSLEELMEAVNAKWGSD